MMLRERLLIHNSRRRRKQNWVFSGSHFSRRCSAWKFEGDYATFPPPRFMIAWDIQKRIKRKVSAPSKFLFPFSPSPLLKLDSSISTFRLLSFQRCLSTRVLSKSFPHVWPATLGLFCLRRIQYERSGWQHKFEMSAWRVRRDYPIICCCLPRQYFMVNWADCLYFESFD